MKYAMKEKLFSFTDDYIIRNEAGAEIYQVKGKLFSFGNQLSFQNMAGQEFAAIEQKVFSWGPTYEIYHEDKLMAVIKKELFTFFHCKFTVDVEGPNDIEAVGNFLDYEYTFTRGGREIARVSKEWFTWTDTYGVEVIDGESDGLVLAAAIVIDLCCHEDRQGGLGGILS